MLLDDFAAWLTASGITGTIYKSAEPAVLADKSNVNTVTIYEAPGWPAPAGVDRYQRAVMVRVRNASYANGATKAWAIHNLIDVGKAHSVSVTQNGRPMSIRPQGGTPAQVEATTDYRIFTCYYVISTTGE